MTPWWMWLPCIAYWSCALCHVFLMYADDSNDVIVGFNRGRDSLQLDAIVVPRKIIYPDKGKRGNAYTFKRYLSIFFLHFVPYSPSPPLLFLSRFLLLKISFFTNSFYLFFFFPRNITTNSELMEHIHSRCNRRSIHRKKGIRGYEEFISKIE